MFRSTNLLLRFPKKKMHSITYFALATCPANLTIFPFNNNLFVWEKIMKPTIHFYLFFCSFLFLLFKYIHLHLVPRLRTSGAVTLLPLCIVRRGQDKTYLYLSPSSQTPTVPALPETPIVITAQRKRCRWGKVLPCFNLSFFEQSNKISDLINSQEFFEQLNKYYISIKDWNSEGPRYLPTIF